MLSAGNAASLHAQQQSWRFEGQLGKFQSGAASGNRNTFVRNLPFGTAKLLQPLQRQMSTSLSVNREKEAEEL